MILIGQYDSSFVRRVGIALRLYELPFEHRPWSVFGDAAQLRAINPLTRVPTMVLDDGEVVVDSATILDHLDQLVGPERALVPAAGADRRYALRISALAGGLADKAVSLFYERRLHDVPSRDWEARCLAQIEATLETLEGDRAGRESAYWFGKSIGHADIAVAASIRHMADSHPDLCDIGAFPALADHCARCEALAVFQEISQPFLPPA